MTISTERYRSPDWLDDRPSGRVGGSGHGLSHQGFTLVELIVGMAISVTLLAIVASSILAIMKRTVSLAQYSEMNEQAQDATNAGRIDRCL